MKRTVVLLLAFAGLAMLLASTAMAVPTPPVRQSIGFPDVLTDETSEAMCRGCHTSGVPDRHHMMYGQPLASRNLWVDRLDPLPGAPDLVPNPDADGDGVRDATYTCMNCHLWDTTNGFVVNRDCPTCHQRSPHHAGADATARHCKGCHGSVVDDYDDGHYIPSYAPSLVTPRRSYGELGGARHVHDVLYPGALPLNPEGYGAGACNYCHEPEPTNPDPLLAAVRNMHDLHHGAKFTGGVSGKCNWCHIADNGPGDGPTTTLAAAIDDVTTTVTVTANPGFPTKLPFPIGVVGATSSAPSEVMSVTAIDGTTLTVVRGAEGTTAIPHLAGRTVNTPGDFHVRTTTRAGCENCHGPKSLHAIQADSPRGTPGTIVVGGEDAYYGHVGRDAGANDSDCWGCHGFKTAALPPGTGPTAPSIANSDRLVATAGTDISVVLAGAGFINTTSGTTYEADVKLTAADGSSVTLQPDVVSDEGMLAVTVPAATAPGTYRLSAVKNNVASNPAAITLLPKVKITKATAAPKAKTVTISGAGFSGYAAGGGTAVTGTTSAGKSVKGKIVSWKDGKIVASFTTLPNRVTVKSVFGRATSSVR